MIFDWMLNLASCRGRRRQPVVAGTVCSSGAGPAETCGVNQRPFAARPQGPDHAAEYRLPRRENEFAENRYQHDVCALLDYARSGDPMVVVGTDRLGRNAAEAMTAFR
jgi:hypothetical protein